MPHFTYARSAAANKGGPPGTSPAKPTGDKKCSTVPEIFETVQQSAARSVTESLVSSGTTPGELPCVQRSALIASRPARRAIADGYPGFMRPDEQLLRGIISRFLAVWDSETRRRK